MNKNQGIFDKETAVALKGVAIIMMLIHHMYRTADRFADYKVQFYPFQDVTIINFATVCKICVSLFAFITGYGLFLNYSRHKGSVQGWVIKRYVKTFSGYWLIWIIIACVCQLKDGGFVRTMFADDWYNGIIYCVLNFFGFSNLFGTPTLDYRWWYMCVAIVLILATPLVHKCKDELVLVLIGEILFLRMLFVHYDNPLYIGGQAVYAFITPFILGSICASYGLIERWCNLGTGKLWVKVYKAIAEIWVLIFFYYMYLGIPGDRFWDFHYGLFPMVLILFFVEYIYSIHFIRKPLMLLGKHSMNIYLVHSYMLLYFPDKIYHQKHFAVSVAILLCICFFISIAVELFKKTIKYDRIVSIS